MIMAGVLIALIVLIILVLILLFKERREDLSAKFDAVFKEQFLSFQSIKIPLTTWQKVPPLQVAK